MIFDADHRKIGKKVGNFVVKDIDNLVAEIQANNIQIAMIAVPARVAQQAADLLVEAGIRAILTYAPISINVPGDVTVQYIDPVTHLQRMTYYLD